jgi:hypothetical protein
MNMLFRGLLHHPRDAPPRPLLPVRPGDRRHPVTARGDFRGRDRPFPGGEGLHGDAPVGASGPAGSTLRPSAASSLATMTSSSGSSGILPSSSTRASRTSSPPWTTSTRS